MDTELRDLERQLRAQPNDATLNARFANALARAESFATVLHEDVWARALRPTRELVGRAIGARLGADFTYLGVEALAGGPELARFRQASSGVTLVLVPGGRFLMGFSAEEEASAREHFRSGEDGFDDGEGDDGGGDLEDGDDGFEDLESDDPEVTLTEQETVQARPAHEVEVAPFLIAETPLTVGQARTWAEAEIGYRPHGARHETEHAGAWLDEDAVDATLAKSGLRLPSEAEWERSARAGTRTLVPWGDRLPDEGDLVWSYSPEDLARAARNAYGLVGHGSYPELCQDSWNATYDGAPKTGAPWGDGAQVMRGGAINASPWQACGEWHYLLVVSRGPRDDLGSLGSALRLARSVR